MAWKSHTVTGVSMASESNGTTDTDSDVINTLLLTVGASGLALLSVTLVILLLMLFVYKTYKTTLQRLIVYYVLLSMWFAFSAAMQILGAFPAVTDRRWTCIFEQYLLLSSEIAWYTYIASVTNFSLIFVPCLMRGRRVSTRIRKCVECVCVLLAVTIGLTVASVEQVYNRAYGIVGCAAKLSNRYYVVKRGMVFLSIYFGLDLEVILVSLSLCVAFCFIRQSVRIRQTAVLLRNSICHVAINASIMGLDSLRAGYSIYKWCTLKSNADSSGFLDTTGALIWDLLFLLAVVVSIIFQAILCVQTSTHKRNTCCKRCCCGTTEKYYYTVIDGKDAATSPDSSRVSQPSYTDFDVPYTGGFSQAAASINDGDRKHTRPLIECVH